MEQMPLWSAWGLVVVAALWSCGVGLGHEATLWRLCYTPGDGTGVTALRTVALHVVLTVAGFGCLIALLGVRESAPTRSWVGRGVWAATVAVIGPIAMSTCPSRGGLSPTPRDLTLAGATLGQARVVAWVAGTFAGVEMLLLITSAFVAFLP